MEENLKNLLHLGETYNEKNIKELSPLALAFIGDGVFEILVRTHVLNKNLSANKLHREAIKYVKAKNQRDLLEKVKDNLDEEERQIVKRGRNAKSHTVPKNAEISDYKMATGLEALFGHLYLLGRYERILEIFMEMIK
ncbi:Mini-ribonuclease 3 [Peptoniphilus raoultii]|uniref:Mini-ribonuclease 3 n=1 Tax=Peptoniphilus raoultii TaxID=1776387 RepID=UPI0008DB05CC|nr:ribonuclease III domain-containing protein [Peptoniphilus raoultii]